ncbi:MAG: SPFH domain-containing protein [Eggerthellaceae bacterium]|nr:SPFH domain-containing protein [Eggerthellaceae bacterium]
MISYIIGSLVVPLIILVILVVLALQCVYIVPQQKVAIIERLGKFNRTAPAGLRFRIPIIERIAARVDLRTRQEEFAIDAKTKDNVTVTMSIAAQYRVSVTPGMSPEQSGVWRSYYMLANPVAQMRSYLIDALRSSVPQYTLDEVFDKKDAIASDVNMTVSGLMVAYGFDVVSTLITSIDLPADVEQSMNRINSAQREKEAAQSLAEAERIKVVTEARARAEAMEQAGIGIAAQRKAIADGISESLSVIRDSGVSATEANQLFIFTQWTDMMTEFARNGQMSTVVLPSDFSQTASMFEQMLVANKESDDASAKGGQNQ